MIKNKKIEHFDYSNSDSPEYSYKNINNTGIATADNKACLKLYENPHPYNIVKDYELLENQPDPGMVSLRRNIDVKHVRLENNSSESVDVAITTYQYAPNYNNPKPQFRLDGGEAKNLALNQPGSQMQYVWLFDINTGEQVNDTHAIHYQINQLVVNKGINRWFIMDLAFPGYSAQK